MPEEKMIRVGKKCPKCGRRLFDKVSPTTGYIEIKCSKCGAIVKVNLALRRSTGFQTRRFFS